MGGGGREREWRTGLRAPVKWIERWARKRANDKEEIAGGNMLGLLRIISTATEFWFLAQSRVSLTERHKAPA